MQTRLPQTSSGRARGFSLAAALIVAAFVIGLAFWARPADALTVDQTQSKIDAINSSVDDLKAQVAEDNRSIDALIGELSGLRARANELEAQLAAKQA
ncbi:MAG TPA: hypothetical protein PLO12_12450, partial [Solirubrobacterales bacterium]|nr:hypothetical protein [Solirubrobacterales bacterium]